MTDSFDLSTHLKLRHRQQPTPTAHEGSRRAARPDAPANDCETLEALSPEDDQIELLKVFFRNISALNAQSMR